jgi:ADP-ribosylglycohydrolase
MDAQQRYTGCLLGLAVGDAVGTSVEFKAPGSFRPVTDMVGGGPFGLQPGEWTDDTSMALCLAESLLECGGFNATDQMNRYVRWWREGYLSSTGRCFDIGNTVRAALDDYLDTGNPYAGSTNSHSAGNGALMRLAPVPMFYAATSDEVIARSAENSRTTHGVQASLDACRYYGGLLVGALHGATKDVLLAPRYKPGGAWKASELMDVIDEIAAGSFKRREPPQIKGTGYVVKSLEAALWAFERSSDFRSGCLLATNLGDDADTTAAIYGQLAGAFYGEGGIPAEWVQKIARRELIVVLAQRLYAAAQLPGGGYDQR